jgi:hypothetical protein
VPSNDQLRVPLDGGERPRIATAPAESLLLQDRSRPALAVHKLIDFVALYVVNLQAANAIAQDFRTPAGQSITPQ